MNTNQDYIRKALKNPTFYFVRGIAHIKDKNSTVIAIMSSEEILKKIENENN